MHKQWLVYSTEILQFRSRRGLHFIFGLGLLVVFVLSPKVQAMAWLNFAQVQRLQDSERQAIAGLKRSLALDPDNSHIRWQLGSALADAGDADAALAALLPLASQRPLHPDLARLTLAMLVAAGREDEAVRLYQDLETKPPLPAGVAARLANRFLLRSGQIPPSVATQLLAQSFGLNPDLPEFGTYQKQFMSADFWSASFGQRVRTALLWRSQSARHGDVLARTDQIDLHHVASVLGIIPSAVQLGPELVTNGSFEQYNLVDDRPQGWYPALQITGQWNLAAFMIGGDSSQAFTGKHALRIDGVRLERLPDREPARAGLGHAPITLAAGSAYVISFVYRTEQTDDVTAALWLTFDPQVLFPFDQRFPATAGQWKRVTIVGWNRSGTVASITPLLRSWGEGSIWFDDFSIRAVSLSSPVPPRDASVQVEDIVSK
jgi:tetratricopeptide (TPR) repeat protein